METELHETKNKQERFILFSLQNEQTDKNLEELEELVKTAGSKVVGVMTQSRESKNPKTYFGKGKVLELKDFISLNDATGVVCDDELSSVQIKNLSEILDVSILDRTMIILDIFANRAFSKEGKAQVEFAQLKYNSSRLVGLGISLTRQGGGIGTRGPGEKKLETDRRHIKSRLLELEKEIEQIKVIRKTQRELRQKNSIPVISLVGYTNAGKSSLMNLLTNANVLSEDKLFATLDTITRKLCLDNGKEILLTDTVGFIKKLPTTLIKAFNATLEQLKYSDILIHVVDISNKNFIDQIKIVYETLNELGCIDKPIITILNKTDLLKSLPDINYVDDKAASTILFSTKTDQNVNSLLSKIEEVLNKDKSKINVLIPFSDGSILSDIHETAQILEEQYTEEGTLLTLIVDVHLKNILEKYILPFKSK